MAASRMINIPCDDFRPMKAIGYGNCNDFRQGKMQHLLSVMNPS